MNNYEAMIGKNIREVRLAKGYSQEKLARKCEISNSTLSQYENSKKTPNVITLGNIAQALNVSIDRLYYGDENKAFITSEKNEGRKIVNCIYWLWKSGIIYYYEAPTESVNINYWKIGGKNSPFSISVLNYALSIRRLIVQLNDFEKSKETYPDPDSYLEMILNSVATEINKALEQQRKSN